MKSITMKSRTCKYEIQCNLNSKYRIRYKYIGIMGWFLGWHIVSTNLFGAHPALYRSYDAAYNRVQELINIDNISVTTKKWAKCVDIEKVDT